MPDLARRLLDLFGRDRLALLRVVDLREPARVMATQDLLEAVVALDALDVQHRGDPVHQRLRLLVVRLGRWLLALTSTSVGQSIIPPLCSAWRSSVFASGSSASSIGPFARNHSSRKNTCAVSAYPSTLRSKSPVAANFAMS
jgi:hypothetical protein